MEVARSGAGFNKNPLRSFVQPLRVSCWSAEHSILFAAFQNDATWIAMTSIMPLEKRKREALQSVNIPHHMTELYVTLKAKIKDEIVIAKEAYKMPFLSLNVDLY